MRVRYVILYKLKNKKNIEDICEICRRLKIDVIYISREDTTYIPENVKIYRDINEIVEKLDQDIEYIVLETYGNKYISELEVEKDTCIIVGAEDTGIPEKEVEKLPKDRTHIVKIPMGIYGTSYNVVTSLVMMITEFLIRQMMKVS